jgi:hypothetical protein
MRLAWETFATPTALDENTFGYRWNEKLAPKSDSKPGALVTLPEYFHLVKGESDQNSRWVPVAAEQVPEETGLRQAEFPRAERDTIEPYVTPESPTSSWKMPGPVAGPFKVKLGDGSVLTYVWYRFADQPALQNADMTESEREAIQARVEKLHRHWTKDRDYLPPPTRGTLADLDPALLVSPPAGFETGFVPIVIRQGIEK